MKTIVFVFFVVISLLGFSQKTSYSKVSDIKKLEHSINKQSSTINSIKSDFIQEKHIEYLNEVIISNGKFWFKKENNLRWEYNEPFKYSILIKSDKFTIIDGNNVSVFDINTNRAFKEINDLILSIARGNMIKDNKFNLEAFEDNNSYLLKLTPKDENMKNFILNTEVYIDKTDFSVSKVIMKESEADYTIISFFNRKNNEDIQDSIFIVK